MSKKTRASHELWFQRNSIVLARRLKKYPMQTFDKIQDVFEINEKLKQAIDNRFLDGKQGIPTLSNSLYDTSDEILKKLHNIIKYCSVIDKRTIDNLDKVDNEFEESIKLLEENQQLINDSNIDIGELKTISNNLKDLSSFIYNTLSNQKKRARDFRREHQHMRDKTWKNLHGVFRTIKRRARIVKTELKDERKDEKIIKNYSSNIKHGLKTIIKNKDQKKLIKSFSKTMRKYIDVLKDEIETIKKEIKLIFEIEKYTTVAYFEVLNMIKLNFNDKVTYLVNNNYVYLEELKKGYEELQETIKENEEFDYYIEKWLMTKAKKDLTHNSEIKDSQKDLNNMQRAA